MKLEINNSNGKKVSNELLMFALADLSIEYSKLYKIVFIHDILFILITILTILNFFAK